ncbi:hypothetical protein EN871_33690, partial [bacterium M00.F.Ca.ET.228.01.1.1]
GVCHEVINIAAHAAPADAALLVATATGFVMQLHARRISTAAADVVDGTAQREVLMLIGVLGVSYEEAADICGCAVGTVKSRLNRARVSVLEFLGERSLQTLVERRSHLSDGQLDLG